ncbi:MAG: GTP-dependent nucleic acid-binding protein EngD [Candidatus Wolfebacteria bacterium GW2011_GWC1_37_10]|uniref:GTP-dependent nucleic acid-binding protein EngD n=1 Tax=Candidatus Wolfebacteria bacterium GW2011_GWC1_37_10 TaxID=1619010 RepID=A0A0G0GB67_9BACT|nr:MAG: GTP-dependent nucleic acid-binding protein EngD [Candidatus Wolfebacteria bacterium GW2011_GWC1_37_10]
MFLFSPFFIRKNLLDSIVMKLSIGIVGLPNVGKSTLFKILTNQEINIANYPFATIDPNIGIVAVPDERLEKLAKLSNSKKIIPAVVEFYDIAGLVRGAYKGEGLGNQFLSHIREVSAIVEVVRVFESSEIIHVEEKVDPIRDLEIINTELVLKDLDTVEKRFSKLETEARSGDRQKIKDLEILKKIKECLEKNNLVVGLGEEILNQPIAKELNLLTSKKQIYLLNGKESDVSEELKNRIKSLGADYLVVNLSSASNIAELIKKTYEILGLISFFTTGEDETRAWTIKKNAKAPEAAGAIHSDFEKKFIRAEVIDWQKLLEAGSWNSAKQKGWLRIEGKEYIVQDGDIIVIRHG